MRSYDSEKPSNQPRPGSFSGNLNHPASSVAFKNGDADVVDVFRACDVIGIDIAVIAAVLTRDLETAEYYAMIVKKLKAKGTPILSNDIWIAANALKHGVALYSFDKQFDEIDGLLPARK